MAATLDIAAELDRQGVRSLLNDLDRRAKRTGRSVARELKFTGWAVADALRTATKIAPKRRPVKALPERGKTRRGNKAFEVESIRRGQKTTRVIFAKGKREANKSKAAIIENRGLAARAWHFAQSKLGSSRGGGRVSGKAKKLARRYSSVQFNLSGNNPYIILRDRINYALEAFKTSGEQTLNNVVGRAARRMEKITLAKARKHMGAK